jgi:hypothetical protein
MAAKSYKRKQEHRTKEKEHAGWEELWSHTGQIILHAVSEG